MSEIITGKNGYTINGERIRYTPQEGWSGSWNVAGPKASVKPLLQQLAALGYTFEYNSDQSPLGTIQYSTPGLVDPTGDNTETPTLVWEYFANRADIDVLSADIGSVLGQIDINGISSSEKDLLRSKLNGQEIDQPDSPSAAFTSAYNLIIQGVNAVRIFYPTLRVSKLVSGSYPVQASLTNVGRLLTTATLIDQENVPTAIIPTPPSYSSNKSGFVWAWFKNHPTVQQAGGGRWNVSQEWDYNLWATGLYGNAL